MAAMMPVNGRTMLETSALAASTFEILANGVAELSRLNVKTGEYRAVKRDGILPTPETDDFETYVRTLDRRTRGASGRCRQVPC